MTIENFWMLAMLVMFGLFLNGMQKFAKESLENRNADEIQRLQQELENTKIARDIWHNLWFSLQVEKPKGTEEHQLPEVRLPEGKPWTGVCRF